MGELRLRINMILEHSREAYLLYGNVKDRGLAPVGWMLTKSDGYRVEPHVEWFPWSSDRAKLEACVAFLNKLRKTHLALLHIHLEERGFFDHMCRYGILRRVGTVQDYFREDVHAAHYQTRGL